MVGWYVGSWFFHACFDGLVLGGFAWFGVLRLVGGWMCIWLDSGLEGALYSAFMCFLWRGFNI